MYSVSGSNHDGDAESDVGGVNEFIAANALDDISATDSGNGRRFAELYCNVIRYITDQGCWFTYNGNNWDTMPGLIRAQLLALTAGVTRQLRAEAMNMSDEPPDNGKKSPRELMLTFALLSESLAARERMVKSAIVWPDIHASRNDFDADPMLLCVKNGIVDLTNQRFRPSRPSDYVTKCANVKYDPHATCPQWESHVQLITSRADGTPDPELAAYLQRWAGYSLTGSVEEQQFFLGWGGGDNGKNVFIETLMQLMGTYAKRSSSKLLLSGDTEHETIVANLAGARMVFIDEMPEGRINDNRIKELTGTKKISARFMRENSFEFDARFKLWISTNNKPSVNDTTDGFWRRLRLTPFEYKIPADRRIKDFGALLEAELPGILNWCLVGLRAYQEIGDLAEPARVRTAGEEYRDEQDSFAQFVDEMFDVDSDERVWTPNPVIMELYKQWCASQGMKYVKTMQKLTKDLKRCGFVRDVDDEGKAKTRRVRWMGTSINAETSAGTSTSPRGWIGPAPREIPMSVRYSC